MAIATAKHPDNNAFVTDCILNRIRLATKATLPVNTMAVPGI
jgi:hypothetical protein